MYETTGKPKSADLTLKWNKIIFILKQKGVRKLKWLFSNLLRNTMLQ